MPYDLVIRNGTLIDGSGAPLYRADLGIRADRIARIGRIVERGTREIDAEGHVVTPGFIDGHTHMDAQVFWDELGTSSCWHGVTSVVMGNCGFTLAPSIKGAERLLLANLEKAEDIPAEAMAKGIEWTWEGFPAFLDAVEARPKAINYAAQIGHSALRTSVMGERAFVEEATEDDLARMARTLTDALAAGAVGFTSSISDHHVTSDGRPIASRVGTWSELSALVSVLGTVGVGVFQLATDTAATESDDVEVASRSYRRLGELAVRTGVPITFGLRDEHLQAQLDAFDATAKAGGRMFGQSRSGPVGMVSSFKTQLPLDSMPEWREVRDLPLDAQAAALRAPGTRERLVTSTASADTMASMQESIEALEVVSGPEPWPTLGTLAKERGRSPVELMIELALETNFDQVFIRHLPWNDAEALAAMQHPWTVMTFSDAGAHVSRACPASIQTRLLAEWVRERQVFSLEHAVRMLTLVPALAWGIVERGLLREGMLADVNVFDPATIGLDVPTVELDLPGGAPRVKQKATGFLSTVVAGQETFHSGEHTGAFPGRLVRGPLAGN